MGEFFSGGMVWTLGAVLRQLALVVAVSAGLGGCSKRLDDVAMCESAFRHFLNGQTDMHFLSAKANGLESPLVS